MEYALKGETGPLWVLAECQTAGRGRAGRAWVSVPGNLHASLLTHVNCPHDQAAQLSLVAGVAIVDALLDAGGSTLGDTVRLKWPNDILIGSAKVGGVLVETTSAGEGEGLAAIIGLGLNLVETPRLEAGVAATHLGKHGVDAAPEEMLSRVAFAMTQRLGEWDDGKGWDGVRQAWVSRSVPLGARVGARFDEGMVEGRFGGLDEDGSLLLIDDSGTQRRITFGDVVLLS